MRKSVLSSFDTTYTSLGVSRLSTRSLQLVSCQGEAGKVALLSAIQPCRVSIATGDYLNFKALENHLFIYQFYYFRRSSNERSFAFCKAWLDLPRGKFIKKNNIAFTRHADNVWVRCDCAHGLATLRPFFCLRYTALICKIFT